MFKHLVVTALLSAPCLAFAGQGMSIDHGYTLASNSAGREIDAVIAPMQDGGGAEPAHEPGSGRGSGDVDTRTQADSAAARTSRAAHGATGDTHARKSHGGKAWQSLLPGAMK